MKISTEAAFSRNDQPSGRTGLNHVLSARCRHQGFRAHDANAVFATNRDIGLTPDEHRIEASKPFWMN
jgi:hypothetical protein